ncbi:MAG: hypothetical protein COU11_02695 [Candidatus Harrisonbacteria bacterium CG10_big_fil_rev_8_21_14_0_10_49_15]|uniref:DNA replication/recombination mediator RecO N-terminal domain-containing protein n=1 Tax=Candidatus Harrisonbacteria bacterium CG10_big_fil_rev_8_21_14_0_10_49_15 TaxID=1974587 RepID=A0A2H0UL37_9BACT|nr:MAG: hypothetical protein COU11_02695 [Candidatus Harrisonbacteria bacterium CG10_big_fil_rev_8_21_14_0_10_49_15]
MQEVSTRAIVLGSYPAGEADLRVTLYTEEVGKVRARVRSARKLGSKLAAHVQPLMLSHVRLVQKNTVQVVDALSIKNFKQDLLESDLPKDRQHRRLREMLAVFRMVDEMTLDEQPDKALFALLAGGAVFGKEILSVLGFDPLHASCSRCGSAQAKHFNIADTEYLCARCFRKARGGGEHFSIITPPNLPLS